MKFFKYKYKYGQLESFKYKYKYKYGLLKFFKYKYNYKYGFRKFFKYKCKYKYAIFVFVFANTNTNTYLDPTLTIHAFGCQCMPPRIFGHTITFKALY